MRETIDITKGFAALSIAIEQHTLLISPALALTVGVFYDIYFNIIPMRESR